MQLITICPSTIKANNSRSNQQVTSSRIVQWKYYYFFAICLPSLEPFPVFLWLNSVRFCQ